LRDLQEELEEGLGGQALMGESRLHVDPLMDALAKHFF
jgi:hypothetical protein